MIVGGLPSLPVAVRANVASISDRLCINVRTDWFAPSASLARLTSMSPITVANV